MSKSTSDLPLRAGAAAKTTGPRPHAQASQHAPPPLQRVLADRAFGLPGVSEAESGISVPGARAMVLDEALTGGPAEAFQVGREFAHLHPEHDGSLHMTLPADSLSRHTRRVGASLTPIAGPR